jgi:GT2 family glycosyltransferase
MHGVGVDFLKKNLDSVFEQTFKDTEIVLSDQSNNDDILKFIQNYPGINYYHSNSRGGSANLNNVMKYCKGELIKILYQDEWFTYPKALEDMIKVFGPNDIWLYVGCGTHEYPKFNPELFQLGTPSCMLMRNEGHLWFNKEFQYANDFDFTNRMAEKYGPPKLLNGNFITIGLGPHQVTNYVPKERQNKEIQMIRDHNGKSKQ